MLYPTSGFQEEIGQEIWGFMTDFQPIFSQPLTLGWAAPLRWGRLEKGGAQPSERQHMPALGP